MRIVHVTTRLINGGADENIVACANWSAAAGHEVTILHGAVTHPEIRARVDGDVRLLPVARLVRPISPLSDVAALRDLVSTFRRLSPDVVHTHTSKAGILGRVAARMTGVPRIVHGVHIAPFVGVPAPERVLYLLAEKMAAHWTDAFVDVSEGMRDEYVAAGIGADTTHHVVYSGMDIDAFRKPRPIADWRGLIGVGPAEPKPPVVLMLAALEPRKQHVEFIRAFEAVFAAAPETRFLLGGDGPLRPAVEAAIAASSRPQNIRLLGFHPNPAGLIALADIGVLCSVREGLPRVVVQYIAGGVPAVVARLPGIEEIVRNGGNGIITGEGDATAAARAVAALLADRETLSRLKDGAQRTDLARWGLDRMGRDNHAAYEPGPTPPPALPWPRTRRQAAGGAG
jgi:glycosyltransferase involved in cell wall biosynthesis